MDISTPPSWQLILGLVSDVGGGGFTYLSNVKAAGPVPVAVRLLRTLVAGFLSLLHDFQCFHPRFEHIKDFDRFTHSQPYHPNHSDESWFQRNKLGSVCPWPVLIIILEAFGTR